MKPLPDESYESWCKRVEMFEHGNAMMQIAQGRDVETVMEQMSRRMMDKLLHPLFRAIKESASVTYNADESKQSYLDKMKKRGEVADHVVDESLDTDPK
jgi:glutamyl-tRNA reductase